MACGKAREKWVLRHGPLVFVVFVVLLCSLVCVCVCVCVLVCVGVCLFVFFMQIIRRR
jgi:hypothetical protein